MFVQASSSKCNSANVLFRAYDALGGGIQGTADVATKPLSYCYESRTSAQSCVKDASTWTSYSGSDDDYDVLGKALMLYNMGTGVPANINKAMVDRLRTDVATIKNGNFKQTHYGYLMAIKEKTWNYRPADGGYLPYRTYIWKGGNYSSTLKLADGITPDPKAGQGWCFAFGERDWMKPDKDADGNYMDFIKYKRRAKIVSSYQILCN